MIKKFEQLIGNTPTIRLENLEVPGGAQIYIKLESANLGGSIKDRVALGMIQNGLESGELTPGMPLVEATSGNTGIAIALLGRRMGHPVTIVMPDSMSAERQSLIQAYGAKLILTPASQGMAGSVRVAEEYAKEYKGCHLQQFVNPANPLAHYQATAQEIVRDFSELDAFVAGIGTGGTISGIGSYLKGKGYATKIVGLEPAESAVLSGKTAGPHKIQGIGAGFIPQTLDQTVLDEIMAIKGDQVFRFALEVQRKEGLFLGISSIANILAAVEVSKTLDSNAKVLTVAPDDGAKYLSTGLYGGEKHA